MYFWCKIRLSSGSIALLFSVCFVMFLQNFAKEFMFNDPRELDEDNIRNELKKAGGANYDAQAE